MSGAVRIAAPPTALAFVAPRALPSRASVSAGGALVAGGAAELWVGHAWGLNVLRADGSVDRVGGAEGLPVTNVTLLAAGAEAGTLWVGSRQGLALRHEGTGDAWRFFSGDRSSARLVAIEMKSITCRTGTRAPLGCSAL